MNSDIVYHANVTFVVRPVFFKKNLQLFLGPDHKCDVSVVHDVRFHRLNFGPKFIDIGLFLQKKATCARLTSHKSGRIDEFRVPLEQLPNLIDIGWHSVPGQCHSWSRRVRRSWSGVRDTFQYSQAAGSRDQVWFECGITTNRTVRIGMGLI